MNVRLPYSRKKRYLTGIDWIIATLDHMSRRATGGSNASQIVLELRGAFDAARFRGAMASFAGLFPVLGGRIARDWNLAPYWRMPGRMPEDGVRVDVQEAAEAAVWPLLEGHLNEPSGGSSRPLAFRVLKAGPDRAWVAMRFAHSIFDAPGAEAFLDLFQGWAAGDDVRDRLAAIRLTEPAHLSGWKAKFEDGRKLVRLLRSLQDARLALLPRPAPLKGRTFRFKIISFSEAETAAVTERAYRDAGYLMFMPYVLAGAVRSLAGIFAAKGVSDADFVVSVSIDLRQPDQVASDLFFNHLSFLLFRIPAPSLHDRRALLESIRQQMYEQVKSGFPRALAESSMVMRIVPRPMLARLMLAPLHGEFASLGFSAVGKGGYSSKEFMGVALENLYHMPLLPVPPGLGFVVNQYAGRMNAVIPFLDGLLTPDDLARLEADVREAL